MNERVSYQMPHYTKDQLAHIVKELKAITVNGLPVFDANIINAATNKPIGLNDIQSSGMIYLKVSSWVSVGNFAAWVDEKEEDNDE